MQKKETIWNPAFISVLIVNICIQLGQYMMNALVPKLADSLGAPASIVGFVSGVFAATALAIRPVSGPASDSFSKKKLLIASIACSVVAFIAYSFSNTVGMVIASRLVHGFGVGVCTPLCLTMASNALPDSLLGSGIGIYSLGQAVSQAIGPTIGLNLSAALGYSTSFRIGAVMMIIACAIACFIKEDKNEVRPPFKISLNRIVAKGAVKPAIAIFILTIAFSCISSFMALYGASRGVDQIGLYFTAYAGTMLITRPVCGKLLDKYGFDKVLIPGIFFFAASFILISFAKTLPSFIIAGIVGACGFGICQPTLQSLAMRCTPKNQRGAAGNTSYLFTDCGQLLGPLCAGYVVDALRASGADLATSYSNMYRVMIIPMAIALVYFILVKNSIKADIAKLDAAAAAAAAEKAE